MPSFPAIILGHRMASTMENFYLGKRSALYLRRRNGSLSRFGIRLTPNGVQVYDHLQRRWYTLPDIIPIKGGGSVRIAVTQEP